LPTVNRWDRYLPFSKKALEENKIVYENHVGLSREALVYQYQEADIVMFASLYDGGLACQLLRPMRSAVP